jgi:glycosyltransferase involved in cell wall biosynthesis
MNFTAVIPTYNRRANVMQAIDSILAQTVPVAEILVVDDGSTDGTAEAIHERYGSRVRVITQKNAGGAAALNTGIREARREWIAFLDSDDVWFPTKIEQQIEALTTLGNEFGACFTDCIFGGGPHSDTTAFENVGLRTSLKFGPLEDGLKYLSDTVGLATWVQSLAVARSVLVGIGGFDETLRCEYDMDLNLRVLLKTKACVVYEPLVKVDRSPAEPRLTNWYSTRNDSRYGETSYRYRKWLAMPQLTDTEFRQDIQHNLRKKTYDWAIAKIYGARLVAALEKIREIRRLGDGYFTIVGTLFSRAMRKMSRDVGWSPG